MPRKPTARDEELSTRKSIHKKLVKIADQVEKGFRDQRDRCDDQLDYWDIYNCELGGGQAYNGNTKIYVPIVHDAIDARKTRFTNQVFPRSGRYVEVISANGDLPHAETALLESYVRKAKLRSKVAPPLNKNGDIEGQYNVYVSWRSRTRHVAYAEERPLKIGGLEHPDLDRIPTVTEDIVTDEHPDVEVLSDADVLIWPITCDTVEDALEAGGGCAIIRRWTKARLEQMVQNGEIVKDLGASIAEEMTALQKRDGQGKSDVKKEHADAAGIKLKGGHYVGYEVWTKLKVDGILRLCRVYLGSSGERVLGCKLNPYWCDLCPLVSQPVEKVAGLAKGISKVKPVDTMQYHANDIAMEGADSAILAMLPIIMTDPLKNPKTSTMVLDLGAIWETSPNDTQFAKFPDIWKNALELVGQVKQQIFQTLGVNPAMMPQSTGKPKRSQAEIANEQAVDLLTTADVVSLQEEGIWTPIIERFAAYDAQFRKSDITVRAYGPMGRRVEMERVKPLQMGARYEFRWFGVEAARNAAEVQQQIAGLNVLTKIPPQLMPGRRLNLTPIVDQLVMNTYGPRIAPLMFEDITGKLALEPEMENGMLRDGFDVPVSVFDDDPKHIQAHLEAMRGGGDPTTFRVHILAHQAQMAMKQNAAAQSQGGAGAGGPGGAGPQPGAQPTAPRQGKGPPGMVRPDSMPRAGAVTMPRKM